MELLSREQREGAPLACAYDCTVLPGGAVRAGLLFARGGISGPLTFEDPQTQNTFSLTLPADFQDMSEDGYGERERLEPA